MYTYVAGGRVAKWDLAYTLRTKMQLKCTVYKYNISYKTKFLDNIKRYFINLTVGLTCGN